MTQIISTGFSVQASNGDLDGLADQLDRMMAMGCTGAEISAVGLNAVTDCRLVPERVAALKAITKPRPLTLSVHAPIAINLMDEMHADLMQAAASASFELAAEIGAGAVVLHPGRCHPKDWAEGETRLIQFELDQLGSVADRAAELGVQIAYENLSPNRKVIAGTETSYAMDPSLLADQLKRLGHDAVMACLDISHAQQGAGMRGFDMIAACTALAPWIGHIHFSDSTGIPATFPWDNDGERQFFGVGDMHAPPGYGRVDFAALERALTVRQGTRLVIELKGMFMGHAADETLAGAQDLAASVNARMT
ncbi:MAG: sugar phosphate isomerase/epimerase family protein [Pseudomonadota bacterium]